MEDVGWLTRDDYEQVACIEAISFDDRYAMTLDQLAGLLNPNDTIGLAYREGRRVLGYAIYRLSGVDIELLRIAVHPLERHRYIGDELLSAVMKRLRNTHRKRVYCWVPERWLGAQCFLRACGWRCERSTGPSDDRELQFVWNYREVE